VFALVARLGIFLLFEVHAFVVEIGELVSVLLQVLHKVLLETQFLACCLVFVVSVDCRFALLAGVVTLPVFLNLGCTVDVQLPFLCAQLVQTGFVLDTVGKA